MPQALVEQLGGAGFNREWQTGRALSTEEAVDEALCLAETLSGTQP
jgi:hypothetical protein